MFSFSNSDANFLREGPDGDRPAPIRRLMQILAPERGDIWLVLLFSVAAGTLSLAMPIIVQAVVNFVSFGGLVQPLIVLGTLLLGLLALAGAIRVMQIYVVEILQRRLFVRVAADLAERLPRVGVESFDRQRGPELVNRFFDIATVQKVAASLLLDGASTVLQALIGLLMLAFYHPLLLAFDLALVLCIAFVIIVLGRGAIRSAIKESKCKYAVAAVLEEIAHYPVVFKLAGAPEFAKRRTNALAVEYVQARRTHFSVVFRQIVGAIALQALAATALLTLGGWLVINGQLTLGQLVAAELIVSAVLMSFSKFGKQLENFYDMVAASEKLGELMSISVERGYGHQYEPPNQPAAIDLIDVEFSYSPQRPALKEVNLKVASGQRVCIVGRHGSGKSTLADLLLGLRQPKAGRVELDGMDIRELDLQTLRKQLAIVRGLEIIEGTIEENVRIGRAGVSVLEIRETLKKLGLLDEIMELPDGMQSRLAHNAAPLSAGQAKRLMLARAIVGQPRLLMLDDIIDDLDPEAQQRVLTTTLADDRKWTLIAFTKQAETAKGFDRVLSFDGNGGLTEFRGPEVAGGVQTKAS